MTAQYIPLVVLLGVAGVLVVTFFLLSSILGKKNMTPTKAMPYESGMESHGAAGVRPSVKFYLTAILFVVFDVEAVFLYPWAIEYRSLGWAGLVMMLGFLVVLALGLLYVWKKGALEWE
ncbi:MAG: NADH-quinone oxidoreductase subunit A [Deltaproteobacteria bacterium]|nr:NADH-quinone oxidoreductase subunit A [Deltaproteobacteria bacterium]